jgi:hypothetical protein
MCIFGFCKKQCDLSHGKGWRVLVEKLDATTLRPEVQPKPEKGKKTFEDYGYMTRKLDEKEVLLEAPRKGPRIAITVLDQTA